MQETHSMNESLILAGKILGYKPSALEAVMPGNRCLMERLTLKVVQ
jgi:hypothetical protein